MEEKKTESSPEPLADEMHWGVLLRSDIQDLRQETRAEFQNLRQETKAEFQSLRQDSRDLRSEMNEGFASIRQSADGFRTEMHSLADSRFYWTIGIIVTLVGLQNGIMVALLKL